MMRLTNETVRRITQTARISCDGGLANHSDTPSTIRRDCIAHCCDHRDNKTGHSARDKAMNRAAIHRSAIACVLKFSNGEFNKGMEKKKKNKYVEQP